MVLAKDGQTDQWNRTQSSEADSIDQLLFAEAPKQFRAKRKVFQLLMLEKASYSYGGKKGLNFFIPYTRPESFQ